jgi:hypothetical protein
MKANTSNPIFNGIIGIGISPTRTLDVNGYVHSSVSTGNIRVELGSGRNR